MLSGWEREVLQEGLTIQEKLCGAGSHREIGEGQSSQSEGLDWALKHEQKSWAKRSQGG